MRNSLPAKTQAFECAVVNLDKDSGPGTHWVAYIKRGNFVNYYDSFGVDPPSELIKYFGKKAVISYNYEQDQEFDQVICGHLCLLFLARENGLQL